MSGGSCAVGLGELDQPGLIGKGGLPQQQHHNHLHHMQMAQQPLPPVRTTLPALAVPGQEATSSRSTLSEGDTFEPGSGTACSSPTTPPCSPPAYPGSPPSAPRKKSPGKLAPRYTGDAARSLLGPLPTRRALLPAFDAAAGAQEGAPQDVQPPQQPGRNDVPSASKRLGQSSTPTHGVPKRTRRDTEDESQGESR
ncbi:hypothetical protein COCSUDRAFT_53578 [Coccomyxa subellipsoidea C-169]|uniref:Uncharacterized protein n=1 Tax=Coccomyxa subellipsoidea (strain C-169) TaxID=574566 RepID=I0YVY2_COCSC|nr:hypothetical protein COCSUDRAFT_53578 [Coccomyxa subellipsoidea C-169]EIE22551.1 hypothetical protein COCSUDRAFT_53578 [Coccomyxa subellipsoidea C-169]|eukprot:XP_005647095.1 hypothetical protein COCSUDRAFT_53578 [Coccomyxa subellipsoidea C-169]